MSSSGRPEPAASAFNSPAITSFSCPSSSGECSMRWTAAEALLALAATACGGAGRLRAPVPTSLPGVIEEPITAVLTAALDADQRLQPADSLWDPEATVIANGERRSGPPRFAGVEPGGELAISS